MINTSIIVDTIHICYCLHIYIFRKLKCETLFEENLDYASTDVKTIYNNFVSNINATIRRLAPLRMNKTTKVKSKRDGSTKGTEFDLQKKQIHEK